MRLLLTSISGWLLIVMLLVTTRLPFRLRRVSAADERAPYLQRLGTHYWLGYGIAALTLVHAQMSMDREIMRATRQSGVWLATVGLLVTLIQLVLGWRLKNPRRVSSRWQRAHFWMMIVLVVLVIIHAILNNVLFHKLI